MTGSESPEGFTYTGWKLPRSFKDIEDGLSHTLMAGDKNVATGHEGDIDWGDGPFQADSRCGVVRFAGPGYPLAKVPGDPSIPDDYQRWIFGSYHAGGVCQFALGDGSVTAIEPGINGTVLGYLANIHDGQTIPEY